MSTPQDIAPGEHPLNGILNRLEAVLDHENARIGSDATFNLGQTNALKSRCLYEMSLVLRDGRRSMMATDLSERLRRVKDKLHVNAVTVKAHLDAVREVTEMLKDAATAAEDDGTYSIDQFRAYDLS